MIEREDTLRAVREAGCSEEVVKHLLTVERTALSVAKKIRGNGHEIDLGLVSLGSLVHDIGRSRTHGVEHGVMGAKILRRIGLGELANFAERHVGSGIPANEAKDLGLPVKNLVPKTLEEKVVTYADKVAVGARRQSYRRALKWFGSELGPDHPAVNRFRKLHEEIQGLMKK